MKLGKFLKAYFLSFALIFVAAAQENKSAQEAASQAEKNTAEQQTAQAGVKDDTDASEQSVRQDRQNPDSEENQNDEAIKLTVVSPKIAKFSPKLNLHGELVAKDDVAVGSALQGQQIAQILAEVGENVQKGQILLTAHLGNVEICKALGVRVDGFRMVILTYDENSRKFNEVLREISKNDGSVRMMAVNKLDVAAMLELKNIVESGEHIGIMGDRTPLGGDKAARVKFLGKEASFNYGPYLIAGILGVKISSLWCQKIDGKFRIELVPLASEVKLGRDRAAAAREYLQIYVRELENRCKQTPTQWFNFFDFWR